MEQKQKTIVKILARLCGTAVFIAFLGWFCIHLWISFRVGLCVDNRSARLVVVVSVARPSWCCHVVSKEVDRERGMPLESDGVCCDPSDCVFGDLSFMSLC